MALSNYALLPRMSREFLIRVIRAGNYQGDEVDAFIFDLKTAGVHGDATEDEIARADEIIV